MLMNMQPWKPSDDVEYSKSDDGAWTEIEFEEETKNSLIF
jgi:hypothetical protein